MGCAGSSYNVTPVTGHESGLAIIPTSDNRYLRLEATVLRLREKLFSVSGDDGSVTVRKCLRSRNFSVIVLYETDTLCTNLPNIVTIIGC